MEAEIKSVVLNSKANKKAVEELAANLRLLEEDKKSAYLPDPPEASMIQSEEIALKILRRVLRDSRRFCVLNVAGDFLFVNRDSALDILKRRNFILINAESVRIIEKDVLDQSVLSDLRKRIKDEELIRIEAEKINLTTLVGILLGFPVVYWYEDGDKTSLNDIDLNLIQVGEQENVLKFSYPRILAEDVERRILGDFKREMRQKGFQITESISNGAVNL